MLIFVRLFEIPCSFRHCFCQTKGYESYDSERLVYGRTQRPSETASLFDTLLSSFDSYHKNFEDAIGAELRLVQTVFSRFPDLPFEIQDRIFNFAFQPYVVNLYSEDLHKVEAGRDAVDLRAAQGIRGRNDLALSLTNTQIKVRVIFVNYRPVRTIPLFHVCRASRESAKIRYGLPTPNTLLFDPTTDSVCLCGQWPFHVTPRFWHVFKVDQQPIHDFSRTKSLQLSVSGFSTGAGFCLPPDFLFSNSQAFGSMEPAQDIGTDLTRIIATYASSDSVTDLVNALSWIESYMPQVEMLDFTISLDVSYKSFTNEKQSIWADLVNIRSCIVTAEEMRN